MSAEMSKLVRTIAVRAAYERLARSARPTGTMRASERGGVAGLELRGESEIVSCPGMLVRELVPKRPVDSSGQLSCEARHISNPSGLLADSLSAHDDFDRSLADILRILRSQRNPWTRPWVRPWAAASIRNAPSA